MKNDVAVAHMKSAFNYAELSYCKRRAVGCVIVKDNKIISIGYNGTLSGEENNCEDENWNTLPGVIHAESNALDKLAETTGGAKRSSLFVTTAPCYACAVRIANTKIKEVYYCEQYRGITAGIELLQRRKIPVYQLTFEQLQIVSKE